MQTDNGVRAALASIREAQDLLSQLKEDLIAEEANVALTRYIEVIETAATLTADLAESIQALE